MADDIVSEIPEGCKICKTCGIEKDFKEFRFEPRVKTKTTARCRDCLYQQNKDWAAANPERINKSRKKYVAKYPERIQEARNFTYRRIAIERREKRLAEGKPILEPRTTPEGRRCSCCFRRKPFSEFSSDAADNDGLAVYCKICAAARQREYVKNATAEQRAKRRQIARKSELKMRYGLRVEELCEIQHAQNDRCKICRDPVDILAPRSGCVDHDHDTLKVRGILCVKCNAGLGQFMDRPDLLRVAALYLESSREDCINDDEYPSRKSGHYVDGGQSAPNHGCCPDL